MSVLADLLRHDIATLEEKLKRGNPHECRFCIWFDCGDKCSCGCGQIGKERAVILERLRYLAECVETGEVPQDERMK